MNASDKTYYGRLALYYRSDVTSFQNCIQFQIEFLILGILSELCRMQQKAHVKT